METQRGPPASYQNVDSGFLSPSEMLLHDFGIVTVIRPQLGVVRAVAYGLPCLIDFSPMDPAPAHRRVAIPAVVKGQHLLGDLLQLAPVRRGRGISDLPARPRRHRYGHDEQARKL